MLSLKLGKEDESFTSGLVHVDGALVDTLLLLSINNYYRFAVDDRNDRELLLGFGLLETTTASVPPGAFDLEAEHVGTITILLLGQLADLPVHALLYLSLNVELVQLNCVTTGSDLLDGSQERLWVVQSVDERDVGLLSWIFLP